MTDDVVEAQLRREIQHLRELWEQGRQRDADALALATRVLDHHLAVLNGHQAQSAADRATYATKEAQRLQDILWAVASWVGAVAAALLITRLT